MILITHDKGLMKRFEHVRTHSGVIFITKPGIKETREVLAKIGKELFVNKKDLDNTIVRLSPQEYEIKRCRKSWIGYESKVHAYKKSK